MKAILIIVFCVASLRSIICIETSEYDSVYESDYSSEDDDFIFNNQEEMDLIDAQEKVDRIMKLGVTINNVFKPLEYIDRGCYGLIYKGQLTRNGSTKMVAMKISPISMLDTLTVNEYDFYTYLNAVDNAKVENYGIPAVYYYGVWENCTMLAITLLPTPVKRINNSPGHQLTDIDTLILFREYVRISKYIHSRGVCHKDSKLGNILFRKHQSFIIDFNTSEKVNSYVLKNGTFIDCRKTDWNTFLMSMCFEYKIRDPVTPKNNFKTFAQLKNPGLKKVFSQFAKYVFANELQDYDAMYAKITKEIHNRRVQEPALFSWLNKAQQRQAINESRNNPTPNIKSIKNPPKNGQYSYPTPNYFHFDKK